MSRPVSSVIVAVAALALGAMVDAGAPPRDTTDDDALAEADRIRRERERWLKKHDDERKALADAAAAPYREANRKRRAAFLRTIKHQGSTP